ncbi:HAMP domain-containing sensor histidine kinase [Nitrosomonas sp. Nm34]|uniref:sensor histidine kinase n=1 Tax=Nitrosomonas sp. Nm34 TaxID=1881055 RepID=UPI0008E7B0AA|nr:HAMP domain-containing sensor histidine kinase [Nitrosomonas sp. Nm34]SFI46486.1 Signal transduction histidine kinase [Nitrosomonas sp. Nm34]
MQKTTNRITRRITIAFLIFGVVLTLMLGLGLVAAFKSVEKTMLDDILAAELQHFRSEIENAHAHSFFHSRTTSIYVAPLDAISRLPEHVRHLSQGKHDLVYKNRNYRVLVKDIDSNRYIVKFDDTSIREREQEFINLTWIYSITVLIVALVIGLKASHQIIRQIKQLANQITSFKNKPDAYLDLSQFNNDEIGILAREIQHYHDQLQQTLLREKEFARNVSHELRTPVTSISLAAQILAMKKNLSVEERNRIQRIQRAVDEMSELIETFLLLAHNSSKPTKKYNFVDCEVGPIVHRVIEQQRIWLGSKPVDVVVKEKEQLIVSAPSGAISVLVANLVRNAFLYTEQGTTIVVITSSKLKIIDTGIGMDPSTQAGVFNHRARTNLGDMNKIGGFGLPIVQRICECYGWKVFFESKQGLGSQFTVLFNVSRQHKLDKIA